MQSEIDDEGSRHLLTDEEILGFARLILTAGSGTTWRQLGILLVGLLSDPPVARRGARGPRAPAAGRRRSGAVGADRSIFRRLVTRDVDLCGVDVPAGAVIDMNLGSANRDPERWDHPDTFDIYRTPKSNLGFAGGPHICLGMHVARGRWWWR